jgi:opacity protein-like surface antigen
MKSTTQIITIIGVASAIGCATSRAENWSDNLYLHTDIGPAFINNGPTSFRTLENGFPVEGKGHFPADTGIRGDLALGYNLTKCFAIEAEAGAIWNSGPNSDDSFYQIPVMLNAVYQIKLCHSWKAYVGAGAGGVISMTHSVVSDAAFHTPFVLDDSDWSPGYQAEAGIRYAFSSHLEADLGYRFLGVCEYNYVFGKPVFETVKVNDLFTHSAQLSLTWKF